MNELRNQILRSSTNPNTGITYTDEELFLHNEDGEIVLDMDGQPTLIIDETQVLAAYKTYYLGGDTDDDSTGVVFAREKIKRGQVSNLQNFNPSVASTLVGEWVIKGLTALEYLDITQTPEERLAPEIAAFNAITGENVTTEQYAQIIVEKFIPWQNAGYLITGIRRGVETSINSANTPEEAMDAFDRGIEVEQALAVFLENNAPLSDILTYLSNFSQEDV